MARRRSEYNEVAEQVALQQHNTLDQNARMFAMADVAMADAGIVAWESKYDDNFWRPITAIREANTDGNPATIADPNWTPLGALVTASCPISLLPSPPMSPATRPSAPLCSRSWPTSTEPTTSISRSPPTSYPA